MWFSGTLLKLKSEISISTQDALVTQLSPDGSKIISGDNRTIKVWDAGEPFQLLPCPISSPLTALTHVLLRYTGAQIEQGERP